MISKKILLTLVIPVLVLLVGCGKETPTEEHKKAKLIVVNVLDSDQYRDAHIKGSINVPQAEVKKWAQNIPIETPIVFYCSNYMCTGSGEAARMLTEMGFTNVYAYEGGTAEWYQLGQKDPSYVVDGPKTPGKSGYLTIVLKKPAHEKAGVQVIDAKELKDIMKNANLI